MRDWLTIELVFATLLVTTFTCVGLLALWAATSPRYWFMRTAAVLAVLSVPLLIPAYEPLIVFALQTMVVLAGVAARRWWAGRHAHDVSTLASEPGKPKPRVTIRFSLTTLLLLTPVVAVIAAITAKMVTGLLPQNFESLTTLVLNGIASGCATLLGAWIVVSRRKWIAWPAALALCLGIAAVMARFDWLIVSHGVWPPDPSTANLMAYRTESHPEFAWFAVVPAIMAATWFLACIWFAAARNPAVSGESRKSGACRRDARPIAAASVFGVLLLLLALPSALVTWRLSHPLPLPIIAPLEVNGLESVVAAGRAFQTSPILNTSVEPKSTDELAAEVARHSAAYDQLQVGLSRKIRVYSWPKGGDLLTAFRSYMNSLQVMRSASRGLTRKAELSQQQGRYADAARASLENMRLSQAITRDGLLLDYLVGIAIEGVGEYSLYKAVPQLDVEECREVIAELIDFERRREPLGAVLSRSRAFSDHARGWPGRLFSLMEDIAPSHDSEEMTRRSLHRNQAVSRMIIVEAALRGFQIEYGELPSQLTPLIPEFLTEVPIDPFDPSGSPLRYVREGDGYGVYSVGPDGKDDGGRRPGKNEESWNDCYGDGDFRLDNADDSNVPASSAAATEDTAEEELDTD